MTRRLGIVAVVAVLIATAGAVSALATVRVVESGSYYFLDMATGSRSEIVIDAGDQISVRVVDSGGGGRRHTVEIPAFGISSGPLGDGAVFNTPPLTEPGTYELYCQPHRAKGHATTLVIRGDTTTTTPPTTTTTTTTTSTTTTVAVSTTTTGGSTTTTTTESPSTTAEPASTTTAPEAGPSRPSTVTTSASVQNGSTASPEHNETTTTLPDPAAGTVAVGVVEAGDTLGWLRSVAVGLVALLPLAAIAWRAGRLRESPTTDEA